MKIKHVLINNFRPFYKSNKINLNTNEEENIVLIGGKTGHGKTSFMTSIVWCLYGRKLEDVDKIFKQQIKNYSSFLRDSFNKKAKKDGGTEFFVNITLKDIKGLEGYDFNIKRKYNIENKKEKFDISSEHEITDSLIKYEDKINFIENHIIPIDAAKFVFFDAEKLSEIADQGIKKQASFLNDALMKVIGLGDYEGLNSELKSYENRLKKKHSSKELKEEIQGLDNALKLIEQQLENKYDDKKKIKNKIQKINLEIEELEEELNKLGIKKGYEELKKVKNDISNLKEKLENTKYEIKDVLDGIPFIIMGNKINELIGQLKKEDKIKKEKLKHDDFIKKSKEFIEKLFNKPKFPKKDLTMEQKTFYFNKATKLIEQVYSNELEETNKKIIHDISESMKEDFLKIGNKLTKDIAKKYENKIRKLDIIKDKLKELMRKKRELEEKIEDDYYEEISNDIKDLKEEKEKYIKKQGVVEDKLKELENEKKKNNKFLEKLYKKVELQGKIKKKIKMIEDIKDVISDFLNKVKKEKKENLEKSINNDLSKIMHKNDFIKKSNIKILPGNRGLNLELYDYDGNKIKNFSAGEKQIIVSVLFKSVLKEGVVDFPVFIDTPLGRLDKKHKDNIIKYYYPDLSQQVVILSTDEEVTLKRRNYIKESIAYEYNLEYKEKITNIKRGYFNEN